MSVRKCGLLAGALGRGIARIPRKRIVVGRGKAEKLGCLRICPEDAEVARGAPRRTLGEDLGHPSEAEIQIAAEKHSGAPLILLDLLQPAACRSTVRRESLEFGCRQRPFGPAVIVHSPVERTICRIGD